DQVHVWYAFTAKCHDPQILRRCENVLSEQERSRCQRFHFDRDRKTFLVAHALVRTVLSNYAPVPPLAWRFTVSTHGKPEIDGGEADLGLRFNLSHTDGLVACAVALRREVGVDVENCDRRPISPGLAERFFAREETAQLDALPAEERRRVFFDF